MRTFAHAILAAASLSSMSFSAVRAQSVIVEVTASESGDPLPGTFVSLLDEEGRVLRSALTNEAGRFLFQTSMPGTFQVKAEWLGRETRVSAPLTMSVGESVTIRLALSIQPIALAGIRVEPEARCRLRPAEAREIAQVWDAARQALAVQLWTEGSGMYRLDISTYERDLDGAGRKVERENRRARTRATRAPFASLPPEDLATGGFVRPTADGGHQYFAPDAELLLSDVFLDTHCFRLARSRAVPDAIGLAFEPVRTADVPDIKGTLWLDEQTGHLRFLEFAYTWAPYEEARGVAGGRVEFEALPDGAWIIDRWWIRAPILARHANLARAGDSGIRVMGMRETGGEVIGVSTSGQQRIAQAERATLRGEVWDSTRAVPLAGATVALSGTAYAARTDGSGRYVIEGLPAGVFTATFTHPRLDSLGIAAPEAEAEVAIGAVVELDLAIPSTAALVLAACRDEDPETAGAVLSGVVSDRTRGAPIPGATVRVEWQEVDATRSAVRGRDRWFEVRTDEEGRYTACGVPVDEAVKVRPTFLTYRGAVAETGFAEATHQVLNLEIALPADSRATGAVTEIGLQGIQGTLLERESGEHVRDAAITIRRVSGEVVATALTNERGHFRLPTPTPGRYLVSAEALGYGELTGEAVDVEMGKLTVLEIRMAPAAVALEPLVVTAEPRSFHLELEGFYRRQLTGFGTFIPPEVFEQRRPRRVSDLLFGRAGMNVAETSRGDGGNAVYFRSGIRAGGEVCWPMVYVNRLLVSTGGLAGAGAEPAAVDELVDSDDVWAMEVFRGAAEVPPEFSGPNAGCGVIVLWTRRGGT